MDKVGKYKAWNKNKLQRSWWLQILLTSYIFYEKIVTHHSTLLVLFVYIHVLDE